VLASGASQDIDGSVPGAFGCVPFGPATVGAHWHLHERDPTRAVLISPDRGLTVEARIDECILQVTLTLAGRAADSHDLGLAVTIPAEPASSLVIASTGGRSQEIIPDPDTNAITHRFFGPTKSISVSIGLAAESTTMATASGQSPFLR